jgi:hypothetical protein
MLRTPSPKRAEAPRGRWTFRQQVGPLRTGIHQILCLSECSINRAERLETARPRICRYHYWGGDVGLIVGAVFCHVTNARRDPRMSPVAHFEALTCDRKALGSGSHPNVLSPFEPSPVTSHKSARLSSGAPGRNVERRPCCSACGSVPDCQAMERAAST